MTDEMSVPVNPFYFESPSDKYSFTDREALLPVMAQFFEQSGRRLLVHGRRRMGKTSLMKNTAAKAGHVFLYVDLATAASLNEVARKLMAALPADNNRLPKLIELAKKWLKVFSVNLGKLVLSAELRPEDGAENLERVLNFIHASAELADSLWTICFDEFQEIRALGGERVDWRIRGVIQEHRHLNYIFSGSDQRLLKWMTEPAAPFFKQLQQMEVGPIDPAHMARWIERRAKTGGIPDFPFAEAIVALAGPCTGDIVRLAKTVFDLAGRRGREDEIVAKAFDAIALVEQNGEFAARWHDCTLVQRAVLRAIADGKQPRAADTLRTYGIKSPSTAHGAVETLVDRYILTRVEDKLAFDSPFLRRWVAFNAS